ncbi:MAG: hypothetical protein KGI06_04170 [Candidatus Micrarchaeota archaeon]|nr:hypothetical protein [Candidatus Micrarchaeota archaeon]
MSFESIFGNDVKGELSKSEYVRRFKERVHMSKSRMDEYSEAEYLEVGDSFEMHYTDDSEKRYVAATGLTYDLIVSLFDVNTRSSLVCRTFKDPKILEEEMLRFIKSMGKRSKIESRIIGMQSGYEDFYTILDYVAELLVKNRIKLVEVDLFGSNTRHIAIDLKLGTTYNVLMEDRLYRAGELANNLTLENFQNALMQKSKA